jgi:hypothetical protein
VAAHKGLDRVEQRQNRQTTRQPGVQQAAWLDLPVLGLLGMTDLRFIDAEGLGMSPRAEDALA